VILRAADGRNSWSLLFLKNGRWSLFVGAWSLLVKNFSILVTFSDHLVIFVFKSGQQKTYIE
jgi:hypothetical protein